ncbi:MAG: PorP/SprF family type IX secretion system membrane protein [Bacteroidales bacterium]|nr:PorP/SprF family type IX secretion system membrane protein [Bacteroidales bacterium]
MRKVVILLCFLVFFSSMANSQQIALYSMYFDNQYVINPAYAGAERDVIPMRLSVHKQWIGIDKSPSTQVFSIHQRLPNKIMGLGGMIFHDSFGPIRQIGTQVTYSYHLQATRQIHISFGVSTELMGYMVSLQQEDFQSYEPILTRNRSSVFVPDATIGIYAYAPKWWASFSTAHIIQTGLKVTSTWDQRGRANQMVRHYFTGAGYKFEFTTINNLEIEPSAFLKFTEITPLQVDLNLKFIWNDEIWMGTSIRPKDSFVLMFGLNYKEYYFAISHNFTFSDLSVHTIGSEELVFGWNIGKKYKKSKNFF